MYCPRCGQPPAVDHMRFCPSCGFRLSGVAELLANDGFLGAREPVEPQVNKMSPRRRGIRQGAKLMFLSGVLLPPAFGLSIAADSPAPLLIPLTVFLTGLAWLLYFRLFGEESLPIAERSQPAQIGPAGRNAYIPPARRAPAYELDPPRGDTAGLSLSPSVTEHTTNLLGNK